MTETLHSHLLEKYLAGTLSAEEKQTLLKMLDDPNMREELFALMEDDLQQNRFEAEDDPAIQRMIHEYLTEKLDARPVRKRMSVLMRYAAAAVLLIAIGVFWYSRQQPTPSAPLTQQERFRNDIAPASSSAILTLADGTTLELDQQKNGQIRNEAGTQIIRNGTTLSYRASDPQQQMQYNQVATSRGGQYQLVLADGTKVWLNAASTLRFPVAFLTSERVVELNGEGYFEVAKNAAKPFIVKTRNTSTRVLGTQFNVNAYADEPVIRTTLIEGSVEVQQKIIKPGQLATVHADGEVVISKANTEATTSWKNGMFQFENLPIQQIMREAERWYDVKVVYRGDVRAQLTSMQSRHTPVSKLLKILEMTGAVKFEIEGKTITVMNASPR